MKNLHKSWLPLISGTKKFLAADLAHRLSRIINRRKFEVVFEGFIDLHNIDSEQPDIVIYNKEDNLHPAMVIEICEKENLESAFRTMEILSRIYHITESFIYDLENEKWFRLNKESEKFETNSFSNYFNTDLNKLLHHNGYLRLAVA